MPKAKITTEDLQIEAELGAGDPGEDAIIEQMVAESLQSREAQSALKVGEVVNNSSNAEAPYPMVVNSIEKPGLVPMFDTISGELSWSDENNIRANLRKKRDDGTRVFTLNPPATPPKRGTVKCYLHPEHPEREKWDGYGFATCPKATFMTDYQRDRHMQRKHKVEWQAMENKKFETREEQWREEQRVFMKAQQAFLDRVNSGDSSN